MADPIRIVAGPRRSAHVYGPRVWAAAQSARVPVMRCPWCREVLIPENRAQDLATWLERRRRWVTVEAVMV